MTDAEQGTVMRPAMKILSALAVVLTTATTPLRADPAPHPVVVELFTSQACSSCPPADALLAELSQRREIIALSMHVDYWDYLGWRDMLALPALTMRQKTYARHTGERGVYTPQMIVAGQHSVVGSDVTAVAEVVTHAAMVPAKVAITTHADAGRVTVHLEALSALPSQSVQLVRVRPLTRTQIERGENAGLISRHVNVVRDIRELAIWDGTGVLELTVDLRPDENVAILSQDAGQGPMRGAAWLD